MTPTRGKARGRETTRSPSSAPPYRCGAAGTRSDETFHWVAGRLSGKQLRHYDLELVAAGACGDLAYTVGLEHKTFVVAGEPVSYTLRVTHVYRREDGVWRIVHRHGDRPPTEGAPTPG